jgi:membrane fusion protein, adhesin transport system
MIGNSSKKWTKNILPDKETISDILPALRNQALFIEERHFPQNSQITILVGCVLVLSFLFWASLPLITERIHLNGHIHLSNKIRSIQHIEGGIVNEIKVRDGEFVKEGQTLLILESKGILAELEQALLTEASLKIRAERLHAFVLEQSPNFDAFAHKYQELVSDQLLIYEMQIKNWEGQKNSIEKHQEQQKALLAVQLGQEKTLRERLAARSPSKPPHELNQLLNQIHQTRLSITQCDQKLSALKVQLRNNAIREMDIVIAEITQIKESIIELQNRINHLEINAPLSGIVYGLQETLLKEGLQAGTEIMKIIPDDAWEVEIQVPSQEIKNIKIDQSTILKIPAVANYGAGHIVGKVKSLSKLPFLDPNKKPYFKAYIDFKLPFFTKPRHVNKLAVGMNVQVDVHTGKKSLIQHLIQPIYNRKA